MTLAALIAACAPLVAPDTATALVAVESAANPYAIGVVGGALVHQPTNAADALATARALAAAGWDYSVGLAQVNQRNFAHLGLTLQTAFDPCHNLAAMQSILGECYARATERRQGRGQGRKNARPPVQQSLSCYYSGNFQTGFDQGYVLRVMTAWRLRQRGPSGPQAVP